MNRKKAIFAGWVLVMFVAVTVLMPQTGLNALADTEAQQNDCQPVTEQMEVDSFRSGETYTAPTKEGYLFSGWYTDDTCTTPLGKDIKTGTYYARFVPEHILSVKAQISANLLEDASEKETGAIRFVTTVDRLLYREVGFEFEINGSKTTKSSNKVYKHLYAVGDGTGETIEEYTPQDQFCNLSSYFKTWTFTGIPNNDYGTGITARAFWVTLDGTTVYGPEAGKTVYQGMAEKWAARIENTYYQTVQEAVTSVAADTSATITLLKDVEVDTQLAVSNNKNITIQNQAGVDVRISRATALGKSYLCHVAAGSTLSITCSGSGSITVDGRTAEEAENGATEAALNGVSLIYAAGNVTLTNVTLQYGRTSSMGGAVLVKAGGSLTADNCSFSYNQAASQAGAICLEANVAGVTISNTTFTGNKSTTEAAGAIVMKPGSSAVFEDCTFKSNTSTVKSGGAMKVEGATLTINRTAFKDNKAATSGGAIQVDNTKAVIKGTGCSFEGNVAGTNGGAVYLTYPNTSGAIVPSFEMTNVSFQSNQASAGGAIYQNFGTVTLTGKGSITGNKATGAQGGAVNVINGTCSVTGYSFADNTSTTDGGAIRCQAVLNITDCTFARNIAGGVKAARGGAIYMTGSGAKLTLAGTGSFTGNTAKTCGNAISFRSNATGTAEGASYTYGTDQTVTNTSDTVIEFK